MRLMCVGGDQSGGADPAHIDFSLMCTGRWVLVRYGTTQHESVGGVGWRRVQVLRPGHVRETSFGRHYSTLDGNGWWVTQPPFGKEKFFLPSHAHADAVNPSVPETP